MAIQLVCVGIDVSKDRLDIFDEEAGASACANTAAAIAPLARCWASRGVLVVFEATGSYATRLHHTLEAAGAHFARVNPGRARDFARAAGFLAKTDGVDARMLAAMGRALNPRTAVPRDPAREQLARLNRRRDQLVEMRKQERTRIDDDNRDSVTRHLAWLDDEITALDRRIAALVNDTPRLASAARLLRSVPGLGPVSTAVLLARMPELGSRPPKAIAALAGLAPLNRDSGLHRGRRTIAGSRKRVRDALYMAAVAATRTNSRLAGFYRQLRAAGKPAKLALVALARKLLLTANALLRDQLAYQP